MEEAADSVLLSRGLLWPLPGCAGSVRMLYTPFILEVALKHAGSSLVRQHETSGPRFPWKPYEHFLVKSLEGAVSTDFPAAPALFLNFRFPVKSLKRRKSEQE